MFSFFFQAEDGIRDGHVTGVQTCTLPISVRGAEFRAGHSSLMVSRSSSAWLPSSCPHPTSSLYSEPKVARFASTVRSVVLPSRSNESNAARSASTRWFSGSVSRRLPDSSTTVLTSSRSLSAEHAAISAKLSSPAGLTSPSACASATPIVNASNVTNPPTTPPRFITLLGPLRHLCGKQECTCQPSQHPQEGERHR